MSSANARQVGEPQAPQSIPGREAFILSISDIIRIDSLKLSLSLEIGVYLGSSSLK